MTQQQIVLIVLAVVIILAGIFLAVKGKPVSYTHLDVYKRQRVESTAREWNPGASEVGVWQVNPPGNLKT